MPKAGMNLEDNPQMMNLAYALNIVNYVPHRYGLEKRKGLTEVFARAGTDEITLLKEFFDGVWIFGYAEKVEAYDTNTGTFETIKDDFSVNDGFDGARYGDYFFVCNKKEKIGRISQTLYYDAQTGDFTQGLKVTGTISGATATIAGYWNPYTPAYLTGGTLATSVVATWNAVTNGSFKITIDGTLYHVTGLDFSACTTMANVASVIQAGIRAMTGSTELVVWSTNKFIVTSANTTGSSAVSVTTAGTVGTDISGVGATPFMDAETGRGTPTVCVRIYIGYLILSDITGTFQNNEAITDTFTGAAVVNGVVTLAYTTISTAPVCGGLKVIGPRLYAFNLSTDKSAVQYSEVDDGSTLPFGAWTNSTSADAGGKVNYRNAGTARSIAQLGNNTAVFSDKGFYAFYINILDSAGTLKKVEVIQNYTEDYGGGRGAIETPIGTFYFNEAGLWQLVAVGATNEPMSRQQLLTSVLLGANYFKDIDQTSGDIVHDVNQNCIFVTCAKASSTNNLVIGYELTEKAFFTFSGWNISRFAKSGDIIYGASSVKTTVYELFSGYMDDDLPIPTEYYQEIPLNSLFYKHSMGGVYAGGYLSPHTVNEIAFDIYNVKGEFKANLARYSWSTDEVISADVDEWGRAAFGQAAFGGQANTSDLIESFGGGNPRINNLQRLRIKITGGDKYRHILSWISVKTTQKGLIKRRNFTKLT